MVPKSRLDALTGSIFAFAMTLLVLDLQATPDGFDPQNGQQLLDGLVGLSDNLIAYVISFAVLALRWFAQARVPLGPEETTVAYGSMTLLYLFFITFVPFSTMFVGRYVYLPAAVWLYSANMIASSVVAWIMAAMARSEGRQLSSSSSAAGSAVLLASAILSIVLTFVAPRWAMEAYFLNLLGPLSPLSQGLEGRLADRALVRRPRADRCLDRRFDPLHQGRQFLLANLVQLLVEGGDLDLRLQVHLIVVLRHQPVARGGTVLRHQDDRALDRGQDRQEEVE